MCPRAVLVLCVAAALAASLRAAAQQEGGEQSFDTLGVLPVSGFAARAALAEQEGWAHSNQQHFCRESFPCTWNVAKYSFDWVVFPHWNVSITGSALNGKCKWNLGPAVGSYFPSCCGPTGNSSCSFHSDSFFYNNTCPYQGPIVLQIESDNYVEADPVSLLTNVWLNLGGSQKEVPCNLFDTSYCPE
jgi:hypothetical protein